MAARETHWMCAPECARDESRRASERTTRGLGGVTACASGDCLLLGHGGGLAACLLVREETAWAWGRDCLRVRDGVRQPTWRPAQGR
eukprot:3593164-Prymnesium_polylepis.1